jgi:co-chaperonin GroES (HSP10)
MTLTNNSGLLPQGVAVLVQPYEPELSSTVIAIPDTVSDRQRMIENRAIVIAIGPSSWHEEPHPRAKVGDKVLITRYAGVLAVGPADGKTYRLINDRDIFCTITKES